MGGYGVDGVRWGDGVIWGEWDYGVDGVMG